MEAKKSSRKPGQFKWVTREARYHISIVKLLKQNLVSQVAELFRRPRTMQKIPYFMGGTFSKIINRGNHQGASHWGTWTRCFTIFIFLVKKWDTMQNRILRINYRILISFNPIQDLYLYPLPVFLM